MKTEIALAFTSISAVCLLLVAFHKKSHDYAIASKTETPIISKEIVQKTILNEMPAAETDAVDVLIGEIYLRTASNPQFWNSPPPPLDWSESEKRISLGQFSFDKIEAKQESSLDGSFVSLKAGCYIEATLKGSVNYHIRLEDGCFGVNSQDRKVFVLPGTTAIVDDVKYVRIGENSKKQPLWKVSKNR